MVGGGGGGGVHWPSLYTLAGTGPATNTNTRISQTTTQPGGQRTIECSNIIPFYYFSHSDQMLLVGQSMWRERRKQPDMMEVRGEGGRDLAKVSR